MSTGLKAFGVTQENGLLRIFPVSSLNTDNRFQCVDDDTGSFLNVAFVLGKFVCVFVLACMHGPRMHGSMHGSMHTYVLLREVDMVQVSPCKQ